jgi:hypothetical protein
VNLRLPLDDDDLLGHRCGLRGRGRGGLDLGSGILNEHPVLRLFVPAPAILFEHRRLSRRNAVSSGGLLPGGGHGDRSPEADDQRSY